jgi:hypothetical protein
MDDKDLQETISRVTAEVLREVQGHEARSFQISDLRTQLKDMADFARNAAWTISYSTSSSSISPAFDASRAAWTVTYTTSSATIVQKDRPERG